MIKLILLFSFLLLVLFIFKPKKFDEYDCKIILPMPIISNGKILYDNLDIIKKDKDWLITTLNKKNIYNLDNINEAIILSNGILDIKSTSNTQE